MKKLILLGALSVLFYAVPGYIMLSPSNASAQAGVALQAAKAIAEHPKEALAVGVAGAKGAVDTGKTIAEGAVAFGDKLGKGDVGGAMEEAGKGILNDAKAAGEGIVNTGKAIGDFFSSMF